MKKWLQDLIARKQKEMKELQERSDKSEDINEVRSIGATLEALRSEIEEAKEKLAELDKEEQDQEQEVERKEQESKRSVLGTYGMETSKEKRNDVSKDLEARGKALKEKRAVTLDKKILLPKHTGATINDTFTPVSSLVDLVSTDVLVGGESYQEPFVVSYGTGGITEEGAQATETDPVFNYADMNKVKVTAYIEISEESKKLPNANYYEKVEAAAIIGLKKKLSQQIIAGTGTKQLMGIFATPVAINSDNDIQLEAIDNTTLNALVFGYGGDEDVETVASAIMNKKTLKEFSEVARQDGGLFYNIDINERTINTVPYVVNSNVKDFTSATAGEFVGAYGDLANYKLVQFSDVEIVESTEYKFREGMICIKASGFFGGNVVKQDGFLRAKKKTS